VQRVTEVRRRRQLTQAKRRRQQLRFSVHAPACDELQHKCYIVATCDKDLKRRIRKIPGIPIMYVANHKYAIERLPDDLSCISALNALALSVTD